MHPLLEDPWVAAQIDAAVDKHRHALTERQIQAFRERMACTFANNPFAMRVLEQARAAVPDRSGERVRNGAEVEEEPAKASGEKPR